MTDQDLDLDRLEALANAATEGPWTWDAIPDQPRKELTSPAGGVLRTSVLCYPDAPDAEFIAASRTAVPALIAEVERLRASVSMLEAKVVTEIGNRKRVEGELRLVRLLPPSQVQAAQVIRDLKAQTVRVREMHRSMMPDAELHPHLVCCAICTDEMGDHRVYPCPTIKALEGDGE